MSFRMVFRMKTRRFDEGVCGRRGKSVFIKLAEMRMRIHVADNAIYSMDDVTPLFLSMTRFCTSVFLVSSDSTL